MSAHNVEVHAAHCWMASTIIITLSAMKNPVGTTMIITLNTMKNHMTSVHHEYYCAQHKWDIIPDRPHPQRRPVSQTYFGQNKCYPYPLS